MSFFTILSVVLCLTLLTIRFLFASRRRQRRTIGQRARYIRILVTAALALAAIGYTLRRDVHNLDGKGGYEPSFMERMVMGASGR